MSSKKCIYTNCTSIGSGEITLFSFPKDPARQNLWLERSGRTGYTLRKSDCLCELHFGPQFISSNQRRKTLVGLSVPYNYEQTDSSDIHQIEALDEAEHLNIPEMFRDDDDNQHEEILNYSEEHETIDSYSPETIVCDEGATDDSCENKRKLHEDLHVSNNGSSQPVKLIKIDVQTSTHKNGVQTTLHEFESGGTKYIKPVTNITDHPDVSIFNIRGEEFIQMPKSLYLEEKNKLERSHRELYSHESTKLREELNKYKKVIQILKNELKKVPRNEIHQTSDKYNQSLYLEEKNKVESSHRELYSHESTKSREELNKYKKVIQILKNELKKLP